MHRRRAPGTGRTNCERSRPPPPPRVAVFVGSRQASRDKGAAPLLRRWRRAPLPRRAKGEGSGLPPFRVAPWLPKSLQPAPPRGGARAPHNAGGAGRGRAGPLLPLQIFLSSFLFWRRIRFSQGCTSREGKVISQTIMPSFMHVILLDGFFSINSQNTSRKYLVS